MIILGWVYACMKTERQVIKTDDRTCLTQLFNKYKRKIRNYSQKWSGCQKQNKPNQTLTDLMRLGKRRRVIVITTTILNPTRKISDSLALQILLGNSETQGTRHPFHEVHFSIPHSHPYSNKARCPNGDSKELFLNPTNTFLSSLFLFFYALPFGAYNKIFT